MDITGTDRLQPNSAIDQANQQRLWMWIIGGTVVLVLAYLNSLWAVAAGWSSPQYSHGYLIPLFAIALLWMRQEPLVEASPRDRWIGVGLIAFGIGVRLFAAWNTLFTVDHISLLPCLCGVFVLFGGLRALRWAWPPLMMLGFMYPWPGGLVNNVMRPLKAAGTWFAEYTLQTLGIDAYKEGNVIQLETCPVEVADACSGLRMLTIFMALAFAMAIIMRDRPLWERIVIVVSSIPIALLVNAIRITLMGLMYNFLGNKNELVNTSLHDFAGLVMMPMAIGFLLLEMKILSKIFIEDDRGPSQTIGVGLT